MNPVALPPGRAKLSTKPAPTGSATSTNTIGTVRVASSNCAILAAAVGENDVGCQRNQFRRVLARVGSIGVPHRCSTRTLRPMGPAERLKRLYECSDADVSFLIIGGECIEHADTSHPLALLRPRRERPNHRPAAEQRDELAPLHVGASPSKVGLPHFQPAQDGRQILMG